LIARLDYGRKRLLFMSTPVVPLEDETLWEHPPFSGTIDRGRVYGRGSDDDKADVVAHCMAGPAQAYARLGGELVCLAAADEESGGGAPLGGRTFCRPGSRRRRNQRGRRLTIRRPQGPLYLARLVKGQARGTHHPPGSLGHASMPCADNPAPRWPRRSSASWRTSLKSTSNPFFRQVLTALGVKQAPTAEASPHRRWH
jgi:hypothetical protein